MNSAVALWLGASLLATATAAPPCPGCAEGSRVSVTARPPLAARSVYQIGGQWTGDNGLATELTQFRGHPVVIAMFFTRCAYACPLTVAAMQQIRAAMPAAVREKTAFVLVSFDSGGDGPTVLHDYRMKYHLESPGWTLLNGPADDVRALAMVLGVQYAQTGAGQFAHSNLISVLDPEGQVAFQAAPSAPGLTASVLAAIAR
jgi:protein SCO1/2